MNTELMKIALETLKKFETDEDLIQSTLLKLHLNIDRFDSKKGSIQAYVNVIHNSVKVDAFRRDKEKNTYPMSNYDKTDEGGAYGRELNYISDLLVSDEMNGEDEMIQDDLKKKLEEAFKQISPRKAEAIKLYHLKGFTIAEIASILKTKEVTVRVYIHRGMEQLKNILTK